MPGEEGGDGVAGRGGGKGGRKKSGICGKELGRACLNPGGGPRAVSLTQQGWGRGASRAGGLLGFTRTVRGRRQL